MNSLRLVGETLDGKYRIERELGKGGMGTVYFAIHLGTERPVAIKVILPKFMQKAEFVERFRREARAAGRLRHPNVVDVTDFGFAETRDGRVAYLVMEYLDGCTLGEILDEEKQLPLPWTLDILEQVSSAVNEAHKQGIIHRDLKPDNIWLEPNQRGGYTVKVLDFGIAKLEGLVPGESINGEQTRVSNPTQLHSRSETVADQTRPDTVISESQTAVIGNEPGTLIQGNDEASESIFEKGTAIFSDKQTQIIPKEDGTRQMSNSTELDRSNTSSANLTRVGAVLGTPLYMSPEQCRGEKLDSRSDIYSLGVIAYQMLGGETPFSGDFTSVMNSHKDVEPPPLAAKKIPRKVKRTIHEALAKDKGKRPQTAEAFASEMRSYSEGIGTIIQRSLIIYTQHFRTFIMATLIIMLPWTILSLIRSGYEFAILFEVLEKNVWFKVLKVVLEIVLFFGQIFSVALLVGLITWIIGQLLSMPLRPIDMRIAMSEVNKRWKTLIKTVTASTIISSIGLAFCIIPGVYLSTRYSLIAPSIMMENLSGKAAFRRSGELVKRSFRTILGASILMYIIPILLAGIMSTAIISLAGGFDVDENEPKVVGVEKKDENLTFDVSDDGLKLRDTEEKPKDVSPAKAKRRFRIELATNIFAVIWLPFVLLISSFVSIIHALLYFKTRQAGGESMQELLLQFEKTDQPQSNWQHRIRKRLEISGKPLSNS